MISHTQDLSTDRAVKWQSYPTMKQSGTEWFAEIPSHWQVYSLKRKSHRIQTGTTPPTTELSYYDDGTVLWFGPGSFGTDLLLETPVKLINMTAVRDGKARLFNGCSVLIVTIGASVGKVGIVETPASCNQQITAIEFASSSLVPKYGAYLLKSLEAVVRGIAPSSTLPILDQSKVGYLPLLVPPRTEQQKVVQFLDGESAKIDGLIAKKQRLIELLNEKRAAIISHAVTKGLDPAVPIKDSEIEWLGEIPKHWEVVRGKDVCSAIVDCKNRTPMVVENGYFIVVRTSNVRSGKLDLSSPTLTDEANYLEWTRRGAPRERDVFFTREAPAGEACLVPNNDNLCMGQRMMYFRPDPELMLPEFLLASIYGPLVQGYVNVACNGSTVGHLRLGQVYAIPLLWCPLSEQEEIVRSVNVQCQLIEDAASKLNCSIDFLREYRTALISAAVTGKIDVRNHVSQITESELEQIMEEAG